MRHVVRLATFGLLLATLQAVPGLASQPSQEARGPMERFIVVLEDGADAPGLARRAGNQTGGEVGFVYENSIRGFSIEMPAAAVAGLRRMPGVAYIEPDIRAFVTGEIDSTGYRRVGADANPGGTDYSGIDIAIIDTGIWYDVAANTSHEDLNLVWVTDCTSAIFYPIIGGCSGGGVDGHGHGTHVAGIAAACDNEIGVRGYAPCAKLWSFKAIGDDGSGFLGSILAAVDLVAANSDQIEVANMSLGFEGTQQSLTDAIDAAVAQGVVFAVAAGNSSQDASLESPSSIESAITVSAVSDFDGLPGGLGAATCEPDADDTLAWYSNFGSIVDIAAPGTCIRSTLTENGYGTASGTSMASPAVAGAAARWLADNGIDPSNAADVQAVRDALVNGGAPQNTTCGFTGDTDGFPEPMLFVNGPAFGGDGTCGGDPPPNQPPVAAILSASCVDLDCNYDGTTSTDDNGIVSYEWDFGDGTTGNGATTNHTYATAGTYNVTLTVTDAAGLTDTANTTVDATELSPNQPPVAAILSASCVDLDCSYDGTTSTDDNGIVSYEWDFGDGTTGNGATTNHTYATAGTYNVTLTVTDAAGLTDTANTTVDATEPSGLIEMTTGVAGFEHDGRIASVPLYVIGSDGAFVEGAEVIGEWTYTDKRGRVRTKLVSGVTDASGLVIIETRFRTAPDQFCVVDIVKMGYVYAGASPECAGLVP